ncbi:EF-hand calcium binding protein [Striga asiatica]|uniref:EF-hand calcium binding protein n=1 Tax=Striga asiatica TaxID=4170 RepID=A0A5A7PV52_STRAF|nr:EF-hand calcium binding protein [Striga asiatica]
MASHRTGGTQPSAPPASDSEQPRVGYPYQPPPSAISSPYAPVAHTHSSGAGGSFGPDPTRPPQGYGYYPYPPPPQHHVYSSFPPGTHPDVVRSFQMVDRNQNGYIEESELQEALAWSYSKFSRRTLRIPRNLSLESDQRSLRIYGVVSASSGFDRDRSGKIDATELRDALYSLGYALPPSVLQVLISKYDDGSGHKVELSSDSFVECGMIVKGLTEKFKEKDVRYTGSATLSYDTFMSMIIPFLVSD